MTFVTQKQTVTLSRRSKLDLLVRYGGRLKHLHASLAGYPIAFQRQ